MFDDKIYAAEETVSKAVRDAKEWEAGKKKPDLLEKPRRILLVFSDSSVPTCSVDGAWNANSKCVGFGWFLQDKQANLEIKGTASQRHVGLASSIEALAKLSKQPPMQESQVSRFFSDFSILVSALLSRTVLNEIAELLHETSHLISLFSTIFFVVFPRSANFVADGLAKDALAGLSSQNAV